MKQLKLHYLFVALVLSLALASCHTDNPAPNATVSVTTGLYVLNQGLFNSNNASLSLYDLGTKQVITDRFNLVNGRGLGDTGNDMETYGSKTYIVMNVSSTVEVINTKTSKSIAQIKFINGASPRQPRNIVFYKNNAYITSYDGTVAVMDTAALTVSKYIAVGNDPEQMAISNGKLYVANSGGLNYPNYDKTVSVIDLTTQAVVKTLTVVVNPQNVAADAYGNVYVLSAGDYGTTPSSLAIIDASTDVVKSQTNFDGSGMTLQGDNLFFITSAKAIKVFNTKSQTVTSANFITDGTVITTPYCVAVDSYTGEVFVGDAKGYGSVGAVVAFDRNGVKEYTFATGPLPCKIAFIKN